MIESIRVLFATTNPNLAEQVISSIRARGYAVRPEQADTPEGLAPALEETRFDVVILIEPGMEMTRAELDHLLHETGRRTPVVVMTDRPEAERLEEYEAGVFAQIGHELHELAAVMAVRAADALHLRQRLNRLETTLQESERRAQLLLDNSRDAIAYVHEGMHIYANASWRERFGIEDPEEVDGLPLMDLVDPESRDALKTFLRQFQNGEAAEAHPSGRFSLRAIDESTFEADLQLSAATVDGEECIQLQLNSGEDPELAEKIDYLSQRDLVTGLFNRQHFVTAIESAQIKAGESEKPFALINLSVDGFAEIRGNVGLSGSDILLADLGKLIEEHFPAPAVTARLEGEHFGVLVPDTRRNAVEAQLDALMGKVADRVFELGTASSGCTLSAGLVIADETAPDTEELLTQAARALGEAIESGGGTHRLYHPAEGEMSQAQTDQQWRQRIEDALENDRMELLYQPIVNLHGNDRPRYSVFVRLHDADGGVHEPKAFLASAERTDVARTIDRWILKQALQVLAEQLKKAPETQFFLKLTNGSLGDPNVVMWLHDDLHAMRVPADNVVVELKESTIVTHLKSAMHVARGLREMHSHLCIDDFGNGLNPFQLLQHMETDYIKLDPSYVQNLADSEENQELIRQHTTAAHAKGKHVIVPHVEDAGALAVLYSLNINLVQGFFLQPPMTAPTFDFEAT